MFYISFIFRYILNLFLDNIFKSSYIIGIIVFSVLASNTHPTKTTEFYISKFELKGKYNYVVETSDDHFSVRSFESAPPEKDNRITYLSASIAFVLYIIGIIILSLLLFFASLPIEDDFCWNFKKSLDKTRINFVKCEYEDGFYYYHYRNKLVSKSDRELYSSLLSSKLYDLNLYPDYEGTKVQKRDKKLSNILR